MVVKKQHYVPQFYLRGFSEMNNDKVDIYRKRDKKFITTNVRSICYGKYIYDLEDNTFLKNFLELRSKQFNLNVDVEQLLKENPQYIETVFLNSLESESSNIINRILKSSDGIILQNIEVKIKLLIFFYNLHERSPFKINRYKKLHNHRKESYDRFSIPIRDQLVQKYSSDPKESQIKNMISHYIIKDHLDIATKYEWTLGIANYTNLFISSDNPANFIFMKEFCFPISTTRAILIRPKSPNQRNLYLDKKNKKYITNFSDKSVFTSNTCQDAENTMLIGTHESIKEYLSLVISLRENNLDRLEESYK